MRLTASALLLLTLLAGPALGVSPWTGQWIWNDGSVGTHEDHYFRKTFTLDEMPVMAKCVITADNIYALYVNGTLVGEDSDWTNLETWDFLSQLKTGKNVIAIHATDPGGELGGLLFEGALSFANFSFLILGADDTWKLGFREVEGWTEADFDDSGWTAPQLLGPPPSGPWGGFQLPQLTTWVRVRCTGAEFPQGAAPGETVAVTVKVNPEHRLPKNGPIGLRLNLDGEKVLDVWREPSLPPRDWPAGEETRVTLDDVYLPRYLPSGTMDVQLLIPSGEGPIPGTWTLGRLRETPPTPVARVDSMRVESRGRRVAVEAGIGLTGVPSIETAPFLLFFNGAELLGVHELEDMELTDGATVRETVDLPLLPEGLAAIDVELRFHTIQTLGDFRARLPLGRDVRTASVEPHGYGVFRDREGRDHFWYITEAQTLIWDGEPYIPVGGMYLSIFQMSANVDDPVHTERVWDRDVRKLALMQEAGVTDLYINPCMPPTHKPRWVWQRVMDLFQEMGFHYSWQITHHLTNPVAWHIAPDEFEQTVRTAGTYTATINRRWYTELGDGLRVVYALIDRDSGDLVDAGDARVRFNRRENHLEVEVDLAFEGEINGALALYPQFFIEGDYHEYWEDVNETFLTWFGDYFSRFQMGDGFRSWIDPLDNEQSLRNMTKIVPASPAFRSQLARWLQARYGNLATLVSAWGLADSPKDFREAAGMIPVGKTAPDADAGFAFNPDTKFRTRVDLTVSQMFLDLLQFRDDSVRDVNNRVADVLKTAQNVPVVHKLTDLDALTNNQRVGGLDGVGMEAYSAAPELIRGCGGGVYSRAAQAARTIWNLVTETGRAHPEYIAYGDPFELVDELSSMVSIGAKGTYVFYLNSAGDPGGAAFYGFNLFEDERQVWWLGAYSRMMKAAAQLPGYRAEADFTIPAHRAGVEAFQRSDPSYYGAIASQSLPNYNGGWAAPALDPDHLPPDAMRIFSLEDRPATDRWGAAFERERAAGRPVALVGLRRNLGALSVDGYYTPDFAEREDGTRVQILDRLPRGAKDKVTLPDGRVYGFTHGNLTVLAEDYWSDAVRKVSTATYMQPREFVNTILDVETFEVKGALQGFRFADYTYVWNMRDEELELAVTLPADAVVTLPDGKSGAASMARVVMPAKAARPLIVQSSGRVEFPGLEDLRRDEAERAWKAAVAALREAGLGGEALEAADPDELFALAAEAQDRAKWAKRTMDVARVGGITVDGDLSDWAGKPSHPFQVQVLQDRDDQTLWPGARFWVGWDNDGLLVAVDVTDELIVNSNRGEQLWDGDAIEIFVETHPGDNRGHGQYDDDTRQFIMAPTNLDGQPEAVFRGGPNFGPPRSPTFSHHAVKTTDTGWTFEARIDKNDLGRWTPEAGQVIGFSVGVDDSDGGGRRHQALWLGNRHISGNREVFGRLRLVETAP